MSSPFITIGRKIRDLLFHRQDKALHDLLLTVGDEDATHIIDGLPDKDKPAAIRALDIGRRGRVIEQLSHYARQGILHSLSVDEMLVLIAASESDEATDIIQRLEEPKRGRVVAELRKNDSKGLLPLLIFDEATAGGRMKTEMLRCPVGLTTEEVRGALAKDPLARHKSHYIYVVDHAGSLVGTVAPIRLIQADAKAMVDSIMHMNPAAVPPTMDQEDVARFFDEHDMIELPVVGPKGRLLGVITADDIFEIMEEEFEEDVSRMAGVHRDAHIDDPVLLSVKRRLPWLLVNLATALLAAGVVGLFQDVIGRFVVLAAMMPIIAGMGGNAATQTLGVTIRAIALGELHHLNTVKALGKEILVGGLNGLFNGLVMATITLVWFHHVPLAAVMVVAMTGNLLIAGLSGVLIPVTMKALRIDPALASTVFVTTMTDIGGFFLLLGLASQVL